MDCQLKFMKNILSSQRTTNILLIILVIAVLGSLIYLDTRFSKIQKSLNYIGDNTWSMDGSLELIDDNTRY